MSQLRDTIARLATAFANEVLAAIRAASLEELLRESGGGGLAKGTRLAALAAARSSDRAARPARGDRGAGRHRRSREEIAGIADRIVEHVRKNPKGLRAEQIRDALGLTSEEMPLPLAAALESKRLAKTGERRATTYFAAAVRGGAPKGGARKRGAAPAKGKRRGKRG